MTTRDGNAIAAKLPISPGVRAANPALFGPEPARTCEAVADLLAGSPELTPQATASVPLSPKSADAPQTNHDDNLDHSRQNPKLERDSGNASLATTEGEKAPAGRIHLRITSVRKRLCDPDNLAPKWLIDSLRYVGAIPEDTPEAITLEVGQRKAAKGEAEHTTLTITYP